MPGRVRELFSISLISMTKKTVSKSIISYAVVKLQHQSF